MAKILSIAPYKFLAPKNGGHWGVYLVDSILSIYNEVSTLSVNTNDTFDSEFIQLNILRDSKLRYFPFSTYKVILQSAIEMQAEYIFCHHHYLFPAAQKAAAKLNIPIYIRAHNIEYDRFKSTGKFWWPLMFRFEKWAYKKADKIFFVSMDDAKKAEREFDIADEKLVDLPFPSPFGALQQAKKNRTEVAHSLKLNEEKTWAIFMGLLTYIPNEEAVRIIVDEIYPRLKEQDANIEILICGKGLNETLVEKIKTSPGITYLGFVEDLDSLMFHSRMMINPVLSGGGVKTKVIESLSWNLDVVSTYSGALGLNVQSCVGKLKVIADGDWDAFVNEMKAQASKEKEYISNDFFEYYYSKNIAKRIQKYFEG